MNRRDLFKSAAGVIVGASTSTVSPATQEFAQAIDASVRSASWASQAEGLSLAVQTGMISRESARWIIMDEAAFIPAHMGELDWFAEIKRGVSP